MENTLSHHGIKGQRWGVRRTPEQLGHRRRKISNKEIRDFKKQIREELRIEFEDDEEIRSLREKADREYSEYVEKHNLLDEEDDGFYDDYDARPDVYDKGLSIYDKANRLEYERNVAYGKRVSERMIQRFGEQRMNKFERSEKVKAVVAVGVLAVPLALASLPTMVIAAPIALIGALASHSRNKKQRGGTI